MQMSEEEMQGGGVRNLEATAPVRDHDELKSARNRAPLWGYDER
jgi:hypothetical protein